jgi:hypothetical protein
MKRVLSSAMGAVLVLGLSAAHASTSATLDFSGSICGVAGDQVCGNYAEIGQSYGDVAGVLDVSHLSRSSPDGAVYETFLKYWSTDYSGLTGVAWGGNDGVGYTAEFKFTPLNGGTVSLLGFDMGDFLNRNRGSSVAVYDAGTNAMLWSGGSFDPDLTATNFSPNVSSSAGLVLRWGPDAFDVGVDNIQLSVSGAPSVPEPGVVALALAGLGMIGLMLRRR